MTEQNCLGSQNNSPQITYLILTFNRQDYARRQLLCLSQSARRAIVIDGSSEPWGSGVTGDVGTLNWRYIHIPGEATYLERLRKGLEEVQTDFICLLDDQDMYFPSSHLKAAQIQIDSEGLLSGVATKVGLNFTNQGLEQYAKWGHWTEPIEFEEEKKCQRSFSLLSKRRTANFYYMPIKTKLMREFIQIMKPVIGHENDYVYGFIECALAIFLSQRGKLRILDDVGWLRTEEVDTEKTIAFKTRRVVATKLDIDLLLTLVPNHQFQGRKIDCEDEVCKLEAILDSWIGKSEWDFESLIGESPSSTPKSKTPKLAQFYVKFWNKLMYKLVPWMRKPLQEYRRNLSREIGGVEQFESRDFCEKFDCPNLPEEISIVTGFHRMFRTGTDKKTFDRYSM